MAKNLGTFLCTLILFLCFEKSLFASDFNTDANVVYTISNDGKTHITYTIEIVNQSESSLQKGYDLTLSHITPREIEVTDDGKNVSPELKGTSDETHILIHFEKPVNGVGKKKELKISFIADSIAQQSGDIWEVYIPRLIREDSFTTYNLSLHVPDSLGEQGFIVPNGRMSRDENGRVYQFQKEEIVESGVQATFGKFQVYSFDLTYHLKNTSWRSKEEEIALPPDTSIQKVYITDITPKPVNIRADEDENWLAAFSLQSFESQDVTVKGKAVVFASPRKLLAPKMHSVVSNTESTTYWQTNDSEIKRLASELKTPEAIYNYVVEHLSYNYNNAKPGTKRLGAVAALQNPSEAICMEFTDLFITLSRAAGIPAREIEGFALSDNPKVQPLSLVSDVLHSWPEYWDSQREIWVPVDPTWGKTTGGQDYFNTFDLKHVAFVIHGKSDTFPYPAGSYREDSQTQKDVYVALSKIEDEKQGTLEVYYKNKSINPFGNTVWSIELANNGSTAIYDQSIQTIFDGNSHETKSITIIPPYSKNTYFFETPTGLLGMNQPKSMMLVAGDKVISLPTSKSQTVLRQIIFTLGILSLLVICVITIMFRKAVIHRVKNYSRKSHETNFP